MSYFIAVFLPVLLFSIISMYSLKYMNWLYVEGVGESDKYSKGSWILFSIHLVVCLLTFHFAIGIVFNKDGMGAVFFYLLFETVICYIVFFILYCFCVETWEYKNLSYIQKNIFGIDLQSFEESKFFVYLHKSEWTYKKYELVLYQIVTQKDQTGEYKIAEKIYNFGEGNLTDFTKEKVEQHLKEYFNVQKTFFVENASENNPIIVNVELEKKPEVLFLK